jgi:hypothetical protein
MFSKTITDSGRFLDMPLSSQALYFHFSMHSDDDGFCEYKPVMRLVGAAADDLKVLSAKGFIKIMDEYVMFITDWKVNNWVRVDRYTESIYLKKFGMTNDIPVVCIEEKSIVENSIEENRKEEKSKVKKRKEEESMRGEENPHYSQFKQSLKELKHED